MKGDFSRSTHVPANRYSSVRLQQGRVLLDAEWNEQVDLALDRERRTGIDVIGRTGAPKAAPSEFVHFKVGLGGGNRDLVIAPGRIYVDGILCENHAGEGTPLTAQPDLPGLTLPDQEGAYAVYLDVWERHITTVDQSAGDFPGLRESALGGPDTATRTQVVWQAKLARIDTRACGSFTPPASPTARMRARAVPAEEAANDCLVPAGGGYRRLENQLYRIEIHDTAPTGTRFKWSRDNGSIVSKVKGIDAAALTIAVEDPGRDDVLGFASARWVELIDEERVLRQQPGVLLEVETVAGDAVTVLNPDGLSLVVGSNPTLRRWDGVSPVTPNTPIELEDGVQVEFDGGTFATGDYWLVPARTLSGKVEWPSDPADPAQPLFQPRHGVEHHYCPLAVVDFGSGRFANLIDCRPSFPPLTAITAADVAYDPSACDNLSKARTVQQALDILCRTSGTEEPGIRVEKVTLISGRDLQNDSLIAAADLARGIQVTCDGRLFQDSVRIQRGIPNPVCRVTIDLPWPTTPVERDLWAVPAAGFVGFTTITVAAQVNADNNSIFWVPFSAAPNDVAGWLSNNLMGALQVNTRGQVTRVLARLTLKGNFIWGGRTLHLDGNTFGLPQNGTTGLQLPSGDGRRGGDFEMWFWLGTPEPPPSRLERIGIIAGQQSRVFATQVAREAINLAIQRNARPLLDTLPDGYDVDATQRFDAARAMELFRQVAVRTAVTGLVSARLERLGGVLQSMLTTNLRHDVTVTSVEDNLLLRQVRSTMAAGNPPDFVIGDEALMAQLAELSYPQTPMIAI